MKQLKILHIKYNSNYLALLLNLLILRVALPFLEYIFLAFAVWVFLYTAINYKYSIKNINRIKVAKHFVLFLALIAFFILSFIITKQYTTLSKREFLIAILSILLISIHLVYIENNNQFKQFLNSFIGYFISITAIAATLGIIKFAFEIIGINFSLLNNPSYPIGTSLKADHNFFSLSMLIAFLFVLQKVVTKKWENPLKINTLLLIFSIAILFSSSRRAIVVLGIFNFIIILIAIFSLFKNKKIKPLINYIQITAIFLVSLIGALLIFRISSSDNFINKQKISIIFNDYRSILFPNSKIQDTYQLIWNEDYNIALKKDLKNQNFLTADTKAVELEKQTLWRNWMLFQNKRYEIDDLSILEISGHSPRSCTYQFFNFDSIVQNANFSFNIKVDKPSKNQKIEIRWGNNIEKLIFPDSLNDGQWHHLNFNIKKIGNAKVQVLFYCGGSFDNISRLFLNNITIIRGEQLITRIYDDLARLNSIQIPLKKNEAYKFENKEIKLSNWSSRDFFKNIIINKQNVFVSYADTLNKIAYQDVTIPKTNFYELSASVSSDKSGAYKRLSAYNISKDNYLDVPLKTNKLDSMQYFHLIFYAEKGDTIRLGANTDIDSIPQIVFWKDFRLTEYAIKKNEIVENKNQILDTSGLYNLSLEAMAFKEEKKNKLITDRYDRWIYALELYKSYHLKEKVFGKGFDYLNEYKKRFNTKKQDFDYPHNIFLSALLYSGVLGIITLIFVIFQVIKLYLKYKNYILLLAFLLTLSFVFFSSNSIFELPLLIGFIIIPYLQHAIYKSEKQRGIGESNLNY